MADYIFLKGERLNTGSHGETDYVFASGDPVPNSGESSFVFETGIGLGGGGFGYYGNTGGGRVGKVSKDDFSVVQDISDSRSGDPDGVGGGPNVVWQYNGESDSDNSIIERDPEDLSIVEISTNPTANVTELGGKGNALYSCDATDSEVFELSTTDKSVITTGGNPFSTDNYPNGMGGSDEVVYSGDGQTTMKELATSDLSPVRTETFPRDATNGVGGTTEVAYGIHVDEGVFYEMSPSDFSETRSVSVGGHGGAGGS